jgi:2-methylcitrate dehydratase PrpD
MTNSPAPVTDAIAGFATSGIQPGDEARAIARLSLVDWVAVSLAGVDEPAARIVRETMVEEGGNPQATIVGAASKVTMRQAALANGTLSHALDYDDTHFAYVGHPSVAVFPAALAAAEYAGASAAACLDAALFGMEAAARIGHWLGTAHYNHGFHQTSTAGTFGATVAAGRLLGLTREQMRHALGLAATRASGLKSQFGTMGKPFNAGMAASNGIEVAMLAKRGFEARADALECSQGFADTHAGKSGDPAMSLARLGLDWWFINVQHKYHACCHGTHASIDALSSLRRDGLQASDVRAVEVLINPRWLKVCNIPSPETGLEAKFSYRLTSAMALAGVPTGALHVWSGETCARPDLVALRDHVQVLSDQSIPDTAARITLTDKDDHTRVAYVDLDQPMSANERQSRMVAKLDALLGITLSRAVQDLASDQPQRTARDMASAINGLTRQP